MTTIPMIELEPYLTGTEYVWLGIEKQSINGIAAVSIVSELAINTQLLWEYAKHTIGSDLYLLLKQVVQYAPLPLLKKILLEELQSFNYDTELPQFQNLIIPALVTLRPLEQIIFLKHLCWGSSYHDLVIFIIGSNHLPAMKWLRCSLPKHNRCKWHHKCCSLAVGCNALLLLKWLRNPYTGGGTCPWKKANSLRYATKHGFVRMAKWIQTQPA